LGHINIDNDDSKESINQSMRGDGLKKKKGGGEDGVVVA